MKRRRYTAAEKEAAVRRVSGGEPVTSVARAVGADRKRLYEWCRKYQDGGAGALQATGRPRRQSALNARSRAWQDGRRGKTGEMRLQRCAGRSPSSSARSASRRSISIFFGEPCGSSRRHDARSPDVAALRLPGHQRDDVLDAARLWPCHRPAVPAGRREPGRLLAVLAGERATRARHGGA